MWISSILTRIEILIPPLQRAPQGTRAPAVNLRPGISDIKQRTNWCIKWFKLSLLASMQMFSATLGYVTAAGKIILKAFE
jgi:hypothetical protein